MKEFIDKITALKEVIAELKKSENISAEQVEQLNKAVVSLKEHKAQKDKKADIKQKTDLRDMAGGIQRQIDSAMRQGIPEEGSFEKPKKKNHLRLIKALEDAGYRESALLLKNWDEMDDVAKAMEEELD